MDNLVSLLHATGMAAVNDDVKSKILDLVQTWASATEGRHELSYIGETRQRLGREGFNFPPKVDVASSMLDSIAVCTYTPGTSDITNLQYSHQSGLIPKCACDVELDLASRIESITAGIVGMSLTSNVQAKSCLCHISEYYSLSG